MHCTAVVETEVVFVHYSMHNCANYQEAISETIDPKYPSFVIFHHLLLF